MKIIRLVTILIVAALLVVSHAMAEPCPPDTDKKRFLKVARDEKKVPRALTTSIVSYQPDGGEYSVDLISALHIGENSYYKDLNARFESYDALLYELIAPADTDHSEMNDDSGGSALSFLQRGFKSLLGLEFQLDGIDYGKPNFVHADMSPEQFVNRMNERGESFLGIFLKMFLKSAELQKKSPQLSTEVALMQMLLDPNQKVSLRTMVAQQFEDMDVITQIIDGEDGSTIISERNKVALDVLRKELAKGKKRIGIFYGAGHMPDLERRLKSDFKLSCKKLEWVTAWNLNSQ